MKVVFVNYTTYEQCCGPPIRLHLLTLMHLAILERLLLQIILLHSFLEFHRS